MNISSLRRACQMRCVRPPGGFDQPRVKSCSTPMRGTLGGRYGPTLAMAIDFACSGTTATIEAVPPE